MTATTPPGDPSPEHDRQHLAEVIRERQRRLRAHRKQRWRDQKRIRTLEAAVDDLRDESRALRRQVRLLEERERALRERRLVRLALRIANLLSPLFRLIRSFRTRTRRPVEAPPERDRGSQEIVTAENRAASREPAVARADIVVCIHNAPDDVDRCLTSVRSHTDLDRHGLILVDDGSDEPTRTTVDQHAEATGANLIRHDRARGYTVAANRGIEASTAPFVVLLNSDAVVGPGWLDHLLACARSAPDVGVVGPLSNAASWQTIPELTGEDGSWKVNALPDGATVDDVADAIAERSPALYPSVPLINGFCYLISRRALEAVGPLDEDAFPQGYGEEDDFCIRSREAGFQHRVADTCYVFHAKSRSYTPHGRREIVERSKATLRERHGTGMITELVEDIRYHEELSRARGFAAEVARRVGDATPRIELHELDLTVGWLQPHLDVAGGIRRAIEMANRLHAWGASMHLITPDGQRPSWLETTAQVNSLEEARGRRFDVLIVSDPDLVAPFRELDARVRIKYHLGAYMLYRQVTDELLEYYAPGPDDIHVANSAWTGQQVSLLTGAEIAGVFPGGIDKDLFRPARTERSYDVVCIGSHRPHKGTHTIERATGDRSVLKLLDHDADQRDLARLISSARVAVSGCWHEGFNFFPLEAMACGVPVVMTDDGGSREYAVHEENALVVEPEDEAAMRAAVERVLRDRELRAHLIGNGLRTAWRYDWDDVSARFAEFLGSLGSDQGGLN